MNRKPYSAGAVKFSFWFIEFRKTVQLLAEGKSFSEIKLLNEQENIYSASTKARAQMIYSTVTARIKMLDSSFYPVFLSSDIATQKMFALVAALAHDTLFFDFVYEVVREKMILGVDELTDADIRVFFKDKQAQSEKVAAFQDYTLHRLGAAYKTQALRGRNAGRKQGQAHARSCARFWTLRWSAGCKTMDMPLWSMRLRG